MVKDSKLAVKKVNGSALLLVAGVTACLLTPTILTMPKALATPKAALPIGTCINLGNHFEKRGGGEQVGKPLSADDMRNIRSVGFATVRMPVNWADNSDPKPPYMIDPKWMARVTNMVDAALKNDLNVILDSHNFFALDTAPEQNASRLAAIWKQIALNLKGRPNSRLWFELHNEPRASLTNTNLVAVLRPSLQAIRQVSPKRPVIIGGQNASSLNSLATLELPNDDNVFPTFHYYEPYQFTHQGAKWGKGPPPPLGRTFGSRADADRLGRHVSQVQDYIRRTGRVPFIGETGVYDTVPLPQRIAYQQAIHQAFASIGVPQCYWGYTNTFPFYDHKQHAWLPGLLRSIGVE